jgi:hypothetical protein
MGEVCVVCLEPARLEFAQPTLLTIKRVLPQLPHSLQLVRLSRTLPSRALRQRDDFT